MDFYKRLNYSLGNEDWCVEEQALQVKSGDKVVCVTASGDRPLHLLMTDCAEIISIDMNQVQNYLLDLKLQAIAHLDYEAYLAFMGCEPTAHRLALFARIKPYLTKDAANFWEKNQKMISKGIIYQGLIERFTGVAAKIFNVVRHKKIQTLLSFTDIESQREFVERSWDTLVWRRFVEVLVNSKILSYVLNDPGLNSHVDSDLNSGQYIYQRMQRYLTTNLARNSALIQLIFIGKVLPEAYFPYLTYEGHSKIRRNIERLHYRTDNIIEFLQRQEKNSVDVFSMSDIASYMPQSIFEHLMNAIYHAAKSGARFCLREFMSQRKIPGNLTANFVRETELEEKLELEETNFVYRFLVGEVRKTAAV